MDKRYFKWLTDHVDFLDSPDTFNKLFQYLHSHTFYYILSMDQNRAKDGLDLRDEYKYSFCQRGADIHGDCTLLEFLVALTKKMDFICSAFDENKQKVIFWHLMANLGISYMGDLDYERMGGDTALDEIFDTLMSRTYAFNGDGGLFPMMAPRQNQRELEIWYQMNQYLSDPNGEGLKSY